MFALADRSNPYFKTYNRDKAGRRAAETNG
jgi:hypothetical protein